MAYFGPYQIYKIESAELVERVEDWDLLNVSVNNALAAAETNAKDHADTEVAEDRGRLDLIETKNTEQDDALAALPATYVPLSRGILVDGTDFNTLTGAQHVGDYSLLTSSTYPNAPVFTSAAVLEVRRGSGNTLSVVHRVTFGAVMLWREATDAGAGTWSTWVQAETTVGTAANLVAAQAYTDAEVALDRARLTAAESKNDAQDTRLDGVESVNVTQDGRLTSLEAVAPKVSNIALDTDGIPYYSPGSTSVHIIQDTDGTPYFIQFMTASLDTDGVPYFT